MSLLHETRVRRPEPGDWAQVPAVLESANLHRIGGSEMPRFPRRDCFIAVHGERVVAVCGYRRVDATTARQTCTAVLPRFRGQGIGIRLKAACIDYLRGQGIRTLHTNCDDPDVISWNARHFGFRDTGERIAKTEPFGRADVDHWTHLAATIDPVALTTGETWLYRATGYLVLRGRFTADEVSCWSREAERVWNQPGLVRPDNPRVQGRQRLDGGHELERLEWVGLDSTLFGDLGRDQRIRVPVGQVLGREPLPFKDKLIVRPAGTCGYGLHQDFPYWSDVGIPGEALLSVMIAIDPASGANGALTLYGGYHEDVLPSAANEALDVDPAAVADARAETVALEPGDLLLFGALAPHCSAPNRSPGPRRSVYFSYAAAGYVEDPYQRYLEATGGSLAAAAG